MKVEDALRSARLVAVFVGSAPSASLPRSLRFPPRLAHDGGLPELAEADAHVVVPERRPAVEAACRADVPRAAAPRAAPEHAGGGRVGARLFRICVRAPLPDIPQH